MVQVFAIFNYLHAQYQYVQYYYYYYYYYQYSYSYIQYPHKTTSTCTVVLIRASFQYFNMHMISSALQLQLIIEHTVRAPPGHLLLIPFNKSCSAPSYSYKYQYQRMQLLFQFARTNEYSSTSIYARNNSTVQLQLE